MGQKVSTTPVDKAAQDMSKAALYLMLVKLLNLYHYADYDSDNYN